MYRVTVRVTLRESILDPQGNATQQALQTLGFDLVEGVRIGKYVELDVNASNEDTARMVGASLVLCAATTAMGFLVFVPTDFTGVAQLGMVSAVGMFLSLLANLTVLPAMLTVFKERERIIPT